MKATVSFHLNRPAADLAGELDERGFEPTLHWSKYGNALLFKLNERASADNLAFARAVQEKYKTDREFECDMNSYLISIGAAVQYVTEEAWKFRPLTPAEEAAYYAEHGGGDAA